MKPTVKRITALFLLALMLLSLAALCPALAEGKAKTVKTTRVTLSATGTVKLNLGDSLTLTATVKPANSTQPVKWSSSNKKIATVSGGVVTPVKAGTATITAKSGSRKATVKVKVVDPEKPTGVKLNLTGTAKLALGKSLTLTPTMTPATAVSDFTWKSSNKKVARVSGGVVTSVGEGTATITVSTRNKKKATVKVKVYDDGSTPVPVPANYSSPYVIYACKKTHTLAIVGRDANGEFTKLLRAFSTGMGRSGKTKVGTYTIQKKERWHSWGRSYSPYASRHSGGLFIHGPLYASRNANSLYYNSYNAIGTNCSSGCLRTTCGAAAWVYYNCPVGTRVVIADNSRYSAPRPRRISSRHDPSDPAASPEIPVTTFTVSPAPLSLVPGETAQLTVSGVAPSNNSTGDRFTYASADAGVATVSASGLVIAVAPGTTRITVTADDVNGCARTVEITVTGAGENDGADEAELNGLTIVPEPVANEADGTVEPELEAFPEPEGLEIIEEPVAEDALVTVVE